MKLLAAVVPLALVAAPYSSFAPLKRLRRKSVSRLAAPHAPTIPRCWVKFLFQGRRARMERHGGSEHDRAADETFAAHAGMRIVGEGHCNRNRGLLQVRTESAEVLHAVHC